MLEVRISSRYNLYLSLRKENNIFISSKALQLSEAESLTAKRCQTHWSTTCTALHLFKAAAGEEDKDTFILHLGM